MLESNASTFSVKISDRQPTDVLGDAEQGSHLADVFKLNSRYTATTSSFFRSDRGVGFAFPCS